MITLGETNPVARVQHRCNLCGRRIEPGEQYNRQRNIHDGRAYTFKDCAHCQAMVQTYNRLEGDWYDAWEGYTQDDLHEYEPTTMPGARLRAMFRRQWRRRDGGLYDVPERVS